MGLSVGAFTSFVKGGIDAAAALDDLSEKTSLSVETLSQLQGLTRLTGGDLDSVATNAARFARSVGEAAGGNRELQKAFEDVGISIADLKAKRFDELYVQFATTIANADDQQRAFAVGAKLAGKSVQESLPFYKDLAQYGLQAATVSGQQAAQAEQLQNSLRSLNRASQELATQIGLTLVPRLADIGKELQENVAQGNAFAGVLLAIRQTLGTADTETDKFVKDTNHLLELQRKIGELESKAPAGKRDVYAQLYIDSYREEAKALEESLQARKKAREQADADAARKPAAPKIGASSIVTEDTDAAKRVAEAERIAKLIQAGEEEAAREAAEAWKFFSDQRNAELEAAAQQETDRWRAVWEQYDREQEEAIEHGRILLEGLNAEAAKDAEFARELGLTFSSAFEDAIVAGESFRDVLRGVGQDLARLVARKAVTEPLLKAAEPFASSIGGFLRGLIPSFDVGTPSVPRDTLAFVHKGEAIIPAAQNKPGAMGGVTIFQDNRGADAAAIARLNRRIEELFKTMPQIATAAVQNARVRGVGV